MLNLLFAVLVVLILGLPAHAQQIQPLDKSAVPNLPGNFATLSETRWMPVIDITSLGTALSKNVPVPMSGQLVEFFSSVGILGAAQGFVVAVAVSKNNGAMVHFGYALHSSVLERGGGGTVIVRGNVRVDRGDTIVIAPDGNAGNAPVGTVTLRITN